MRLISPTLSTSLALAFATGAVVPHAALAASFGHGDGRVPVHIANKSDEAETIKVDGHVYVVKAHESVDVKVPAGSIVYAAGNTAHHQDGDKLITVTSEMKGSTINLEGGAGA